MRKWRVLHTVALVVVALTLTSCKVSESASTDVEDAEPVTDLRRGDEGADVAQLQRRLRVLGADTAINGTFDPATETSVREIQRFFGLAVDGIVGARTHALIDELYRQVPKTSIDLEDATVIAHVADGSVCFELLAGARGGHACVAERSELSAAYVAIEDDQSLRLYLVGAGASPTAMIVGDGIDGQPVALDVVPVEASPSVAFVHDHDRAPIAALRAADAAASEIGRLELRLDDDVDLSVGDVGPAVVRWQQLLAEHESEIHVDGVFSFTMAHVLAAAQSFVGLEPSGVLDAATRNALLGVG
jgi:peptidoglycan hydrolase-like protein with peptidoglycan-binding domain